MSPQAFTTKDFVIVVVIIAILSAIAIPNFISAQNRAKEGRTKASMQVVALAAEEFGTRSNGIYPTNIDPALLRLLPGAGRQPNSFTGSRTEPQQGPAPETAPPGSVWYMPVLDSAGVPRGYLIEGFGVEGRLELAIGSEGYEKLIARPASR